MILDDNSMEILKAPRSVAEVRIATLLRAQGRLEAAVAGKLPQAELVEVLTEAEPAVIVVPTTSSAEQQQSVIDPQQDKSDELDISAIRQDVNNALLDQLEESQDEAA